jgi:hypothetical protein
MLGAYYLGPPILVDCTCRGSYTSPRSNSHDQSEKYGYICDAFFPKKDLSISHRSHESSLEIVPIPHL